MSGRLATAISGFGTRAADAPSRTPRPAARMTVCVTCSTAEVIDPILVLAESSTVDVERLARAAITGERARAFEAPLRERETLSGRCGECGQSRSQTPDIFRMDADRSARRH